MYVVYGMQNYIRLPRGGWKRKETHVVMSWCFLIPLRIPVPAWLLQTCVCGVVVGGGKTLHLGNEWWLVQALIAVCDTVSGLRYKVLPLRVSHRGWGALGYHPSAKNLKTAPKLTAV